jgi:hypothetical protein
MMALAPRTVQKIPERFSLPNTVLTPLIGFVEDNWTRASPMLWAT